MTPRTSPTRRGSAALGTRLVGLAASLAVLGIVLGLPVTLLALGATPVPHGLPSPQQVRTALLSPDDGTTALAAVKALGWACWLFLTGTILLEVAARLRGMHAPQLPGLGLPQSAARGLVGAALLLVVAAPVAAPAARAAAVSNGPAPAATTAGTTAAGDRPIERNVVDLRVNATSTGTPASAGGLPHAEHHRDAHRPTGRQQIPRAHTVRPGESLWSIAQDHLGAGTRYDEIADLNTDVLDGHPGFLLPGTVLRLPSPAARPDDPSHRRTHRYTVRAGDTLSQIAEDQLGDAARYPEIAAASRHTAQPGGAQLRDPDIIDVGWTLTIPNDTTEQHEQAPGLGGATRAPRPTDGDGRPPARHPAPTDDQPNDTSTDADGDRADHPVATATAQPTGTPAARPQVPGPPVSEHDTSSATGQAASPEHAASNGHSGSTRATGPDRQDRQHPRGEVGQRPELGDESDEHAHDQAPWLLAGLTGGGAILAGGLFLALRQRRAAQFRARRPGRTIATPAPVLAPVEKTVTAVGAGAAPILELIDDCLRRLAAAHAHQQKPMPELAAVELADNHLVLHLANPADLDQAWQPGPNRKHWTLGTPLDQFDQLDRDTVGPEVVDQPAPYPLLVTVGTSDDGAKWLLDFEDHNVRITGDPTFGRDFARYLAAEIACNPWSHGVRVDCVGVAEEVAPMNPERIHSHRGDINGGDADPAAAILADAVTLIDRSADAALDVPTARAAQAGADTWPARLLLVDAAATGRTPALTQLIALVGEHAGHTGTSVVLHGQPPAPASDVTPGIELRVTADGRIALPHAGLDLVAVGLTSDEAQGCAALLAVADDLTDAAIPVDPDAADGWRSWSNQAGALRAEHTLPRHAEAADPAAARDDDTAVEAAESILDRADEDYLPKAATTVQDLAALAPRVPDQVRAGVVESDPTLDGDLAAWFAPDCPLPRLTLLGPVHARTRGVPVSKRKPYYTEFLAYLATRPHGVTSEELAAAFDITPGKAREYVRTVREWLGTNPRTGEKHLPDARQTPAAQARGIGVYQVVDLLCDVDLFRRLRVRGEASGPAGMEDLRTAMRLVQGRPFDKVRDGGWCWLSEGDRLDQHMTCAIVDVAHLVTTHSLHAADLRQARLAAETAALAAPYEEIPRLDLAAVTAAEGHHGEAERILRDRVANRTDDDGAPPELPERSQQVIADRGWLPRHKEAG